MTFILVLITFVLGLFSGFTLLSYHGHEPVNIIYFMTIVVFFPLFTMMLTLFGMFRANATSSVLMHLSPAFWMEKILEFFPFKNKINFDTIKLSPLLSNWILIKRSQFITLFFSLGLLFALLSMVVTKDIAFAWSTTLHISAQEFQSFLHFLSLPWGSFFPSAVPSLELIEQSQYFRLGDKLSHEMIANASALGEWWKFLACATIFYAIFLRYLMYVLASFGLTKAIERSLLSLKGAKKLLRQMNEPIISTHSNKQSVDVVPVKIARKSPTKELREENLESPKEQEQEEEKEQELITETLKELEKLEEVSKKISYKNIQGWAMRPEQILLLSDSFEVTSKEYFEVGGSRSFEEDAEVISKSKGEVLLFVKAWEPPTMDFVDYLEDLSQKVQKITLLPVGTTENNYQSREQYVDVWEDKLTLIENEKVWLQR